MYRSIVVGANSSPTARTAVRHAAALASAFGSELHLVTAYRAGEGAMALTTVEPDALLKVAEALVPESPIAEALTGMLEDLRELEDAGLRVRCHALPGDAAEVLLDVASGQAADLLVVGNRGMAGARRIWLSSVPDKVSHQAPCSVLIVHTT